MLKYILKRLALGVCAIFVLATVTFFLMKTIPGNPFHRENKTLTAEQMAKINEQFGLDKPIFEQYLTFEDELTPAFCRQIAPVLERFGGRIEGKKLVLSCKSGNMTLLCRTLYRYLQAAVLLSRFGGPIPVYRT